MRLDWPLQPAPDSERLRSAAQDWKDRLERFPQPWTVLLFGGESYPFRLGVRDAETVFRPALRRARERGGSLMISTSRRTPAPVVEYLRERAAPDTETGVFLFGWNPEANENPYPALLEGGHEFVVTRDSISMLVEVARLGRPLAIAAQEPSRVDKKERRNRIKRLFHGSMDAEPSCLMEMTSDLASLYGLKFVRSLESVSERMIEQGWAGRFPEFGDPDRPALPDEDFERAVARVRTFLR